MKRGFGAPLVEKFLPGRDVRLIVDTSGAHIPGHGTPTVLIFGRNAAPQGANLMAVFSLRGEPGIPVDPAKSRVWSSIQEHALEDGYQDEWVSVSSTPRVRFAKHPMILSAGDSEALLTRLDDDCVTLDKHAQTFGYSGQTNADSAFLASAGAFSRRGVMDALHRPFVAGEAIRDFSIAPGFDVLFPYSADGLIRLASDDAAYRWLWPVRQITWSRATFSKSTYKDEGRSWWEWHQISLGRVGDLVTVGYPNVATHNHFVRDLGQHLFNPTAQFIQFPDGISDRVVDGMVAVLNSSTACFWLKKNSHNKGNGGIGGGIGDEEWEPRYQFVGAVLKRFPLPKDIPSVLGMRALEAVNEFAAVRHPEASLTTVTPSRELLDESAKKFVSGRRRLIAAVEEMDWAVYRLYDLIDEDLTYSGDDLPDMALGERAFEIVLGRKLKAGIEDTAWFDRHGSTPITEVPSHWPAEYRRLVERRIELIESHPYLRLLEKPEHKRRWASESWAKQEERALRGWLLDRLENQKHWTDPQGRPTPKSAATLADEVSRDAELVDVLALWEGRPDVTVVESLTKLLAKEGVPYLAAYRYKESGLRKRAAWEHIWDLQRGEDAGTYDPSPRDRGGDGPIPVPPKYTSADFARTEFWSHRGKLDVPKERFILYPNAGRETDPTPVLGWAGWDHAQQALALAMLIQDRQDLDGWSDEQLVPLVAGLAEVLPWVEQWHAEPSDLYGGVSPAEFFGQQLEERMAQVSATRDTLQEWRPAPPVRGRKRNA